MLFYFLFSFNLSGFITFYLIFLGKNITDQDMKQLLRILVKALESFNDVVLLEALVMCLTRLQPLLRPVSILFYLLLFCFNLPFF